MSEPSKGRSSQSALATFEPNSQLPLWPETLHGVPWATLRSALFAPIRPGARAALTRERIAAVGDYRIIYTGIRLDQADLDVYEQILHLARKTNLGQPVRFRTRALLRTLGRAEGKSNREWLLRSLSRLSACEIEVGNGRATYAGSLIHEQGRDDEAGLHYIILNPRLTALYTQGWAAIRPEERKALGQQQLAKWLHGFLHGQRHPLTFDTDNLSKLAGGNYARQRDFRRAIDEAAASLNDLLGMQLLLVWDLKRNHVTFTRTSWCDTGGV